MSPLTDTAAALDEMAYAFDELDADGVILFPRYDKIYLGGSHFQTIRSGLDRRLAVVLGHTIRSRT